MLRNCYIISRDDDKYEIIKTSSKWYLKDGEIAKKSSTTLEEIDAITTCFSSRNKLVHFLKKQDVLHNDTIDLDLYIFKNKRGTSIQYNNFEIIYDDKNNKELINNLRLCAYNSLKRNEKKHLNQMIIHSKKIYYYFIERCFNSNNFYTFVRKSILLPKKIKDIIDNNKTNKKLEYAIKDDNEWILESYTTIRNLVELTCRYDRYKDNNYDNIDINELNKYNINLLFHQRNKIKNKLLLDTHKDNIIGQITIEDYIESFNNNQINIKQLSHDDKVKFILTNLKNINYDCFIEENNKINTKDEYSKLKCFSQKLFRYIWMYTLHNKNIKEAYELGINTRILEEDLISDYNSIRNIIKKNQNTCDKLYNWIINYIKIKEENNNNKKLIKK